MAIRQDKFKVGDLVTWHDARFANLTNGIENFGEGPFKIIEIDEVKFESYIDYECPSNWAAMGHTQLVTICLKAVRYLPPTKQFSGAFFKKVN